MRQSFTQQTAIISRISESMVSVTRCQTLDVQIDLKDGELVVFSVLTIVVDNLLIAID